MCVTSAATYAIGGCGHGVRGITNEGLHTLLDTWQTLQARLFHLGYLGEELAEVVGSSPAHTAWLYRVIADEAGRVAADAAAYITECERAAARPYPDNPDCGDPFTDAADDVGAPARDRRVGGGL